MAQTATCAAAGEGLGRRAQGRWAPHMLRDRYDAAVPVVTAAIGAEEHYLANMRSNAARREGLEEAAALDELVEDSSEAAAEGEDRDGIERSHRAYARARLPRAEEKGFGFAAMRDMASTAAGSPCPAFVTNTPDEKSSHWLPCRSNTCTPSARSHKIKGCPPIERGSQRRRTSITSRSSGCGIGVEILRFAV